MTQIPNFTKIAFKTKPRLLGITPQEEEDTAKFNSRRRRKRFLSVVEMFNVEPGKQVKTQNSLSTWGNVRENLTNPMSSTRRHSEGYAALGRRDRLSISSSFNHGNLSSIEEKRFSREHSDISRRSSVVGGLLGTAAFKRQLTRKSVNLKRRLMLYMKFKMLGRLTILLHRMCTLHFQELQDDEEDSNAMSFAQIAFHGKRDPSVDLMFDVSKFKANKEYRISSDTKAVMKLHPHERTDDDINVIQRTLLDLRSFAEYPVKMQVKVAKVGWLQTFNPKRVVVREGHPPQYFYFLISGSILITSTNDSYTDGSKSISVLKRGSSFGDLAILQNAKRTFTATASEKVELFCISKKDFISIFMAGGEKKLQDPELLKFIRNLEFLKNWPIELLEDHPEKCMFNYFKQGTLLVEDSSSNDKIFIVKSGSCTVLKKLRCKRSSSLKKNRRDNAVAKIVVTNEEEEKELTHKELIEQKEKLFLKRKIKSLKKTNTSLYDRGLNLPLLRAKSTGSDVMRDRPGSILSAISERDSAVSHDFILLDDLVDESLSGSSSRSGYCTSHDDVRCNNLCFSQFYNIPMDTDQGNTVGKCSEASQALCTERQHPSTRRKKTVETWLSDLPVETRTLTDAKCRNTKNDSTHRKHQVSPHQINVIPQQDTVLLSPIQRDVKEHSTSTTSVLSNVSKLSKANNRFVFIEVQKLHKGCVFGLSSDLFGNQPTLSLVSDGAECLVLSKQFFLENATDFQIHEIRVAGVPYPTDEELQVNLERHEAWNVYRNKTLNDVIDFVTLNRRKKIRQLLPLF
ncbi:uncharacterized protein [Antedon mediterranea]|uniref:uncharacterized protein isoform X2 n=1 Tax=Antedon mediterranea TaxID=105859 RepID=UPI003AF6D867